MCDGARMSYEYDYDHPRKQRKLRAGIAATAAALVISGGALTMSQLAIAKDAPPKQPPVKLSVSDKPVTREAGITTFAPTVKKVTPSVVQVYVSTKVKNTAHQLPDGFGNNPMLRRFFGDDFDSEQFGRRQMPQPRQRGTGSGVIVTKDGYLLTNNHVVDGADEVKVALNDGREFTAKVVGKDPKSDIAVLKIDGSNLPAIEIADSELIEVGDVVLAVGNPFGIGQTVTTGIVSATGRGHLGLDYEDMIQTDAAINPGNSGGALVDADGRLIGINTAIISRSGGNQGIGFAVPVNLARSVMESLVQDGRVVRGFMGVSIQDITPVLAKEFDLDEAKGALVGGVTPKSPAEKAGLQSGDVIVEFDGKAVRDSRNLKLQVAQTRPGSKVPVKVLRDGKTVTLDVVVKELPGSQVAANKRDNSPESEATDALDGVAVTDIDPATKNQLQLPANLKGAVVSEVQPDSAAFNAGLRPGDVILEINRKPVKNAEDAVTLTENAKDKRTLLRVWSQGGSRYVVVDESNAG